MVSVSIVVDRFHFSNTTHILAISLLGELWLLLVRKLLEFTYIYIYILCLEVWRIKFYANIAQLLLIFVHKTCLLNSCVQLCRQSRFVTHTHNIYRNVRCAAKSIEWATNCYIYATTTPRTCVSSGRVCIYTLATHTSL